MSVGSVLGLICIKEQSGELSAHNGRPAGYPERAHDWDDVRNAVRALGKWVEVATTPLSAQWLEWLHPMRVSRYAFASDFNPWLHAWAPIAAKIAQDRHAVADTNPLKNSEIAASDAMRDFITRTRELRDLGYEFWFEMLYGRAIAAHPVAVSRPSATNAQPACGRPT